jgi:hypothetical protein
METEKELARANTPVRKEGVEGDASAEQAAHQDEKGENVEAPPVTDRRLVVRTGGEEEEQAMEEEEEFEFEENTQEDGQLRGWFVVARYYSRKSYPVKVLFSDLFRIWGDGTVRELGDNRYLLEFTTEDTLSFVLRGGPWSFKGDAIITVPYDGLSKLSAVIIESIHIWIRLYDLPVAMMTNAFVKSLGTKVGRVLEIGEDVKDFKRVRVDFALSDALVQTVGIKVRGRGFREFAVKYENVPHFCFTCGRIGHAERECPEEFGKEESTRFGTELRVSPFKRRANGFLSFQATATPSAKRGLNFSGEQRDSVMSRSSSSPLNATRQSQPKQFDGQVPRGESAGGTNSSMMNKATSPVAADLLAKGVKDMAVDRSPPASAQTGKSRSAGLGVQRVSGLDSYAGFSEASMYTDPGALAKAKAGAEEEVVKQKRKRLATTKILEEGELDCAGDVRMQDQDVRRNASVTGNLTGTHGEPRQEK